MEDIYVKPGNQERGWNDPPQFSYGLQVTHGSQRNLLNKRPGPATASGVPGVLHTPPNSSTTAAPPMCGVAPPPLSQVRPPADGVATPPPPAGPMKSQRGASSSQSEPELETVMLVLNKALDVCRRAVKDQVCNDVAKRLRLLEENWRTDKLSLPVRRRMGLLALEVQAGRWDSADDLHRSLMVDHVTEVSQWMVGVKRLIAETRNLSPELLEPLHSTAPPVQDLIRPVQDLIRPVQDLIRPVQDPIRPVQDQIRPVQDQIKPIQDQIRPIQDQIRPVQDQIRLVQDQIKPVQDQIRPVQDPIKPIQDPIRPVQDQIKPVQDPIKPVQDPIRPVQDPIRPVQDPIRPVQDPGHQS